MYLNSIQAYVAVKNFKNYSKKLEKLSQIREIYNTLLGYNNTSNHLYRIKVKDNKKIMELLKKEGITTGIHYKCLHNHPVYASTVIDRGDGKYVPHTLKNSELEEQQTLSIPFHEDMSAMDVHNVVENVKKYII